MGFLRKLLGKNDPIELEILDKSIQYLRLGLFNYLCKKEYVHTFGDEEAKYWAAAVLNVIVLEDPGNEQGHIFYDKNKERILQFAKNIDKNKELSEVASYLYAAQTIYLAFMTKDPFSKRAKELGEQATCLGFYIPNTYDICGSGDIRECIMKIAEFANGFWDKYSKE